MDGILHVHSTYSTHDSAQTPEEIVVRAKELNCANVTLTDHGTLMGIENFMSAGKKHGINTIPGIETYIKEKRHLILVAKNYKGYRDICHAVKEANRNIIEKRTGGSETKSLTYPIMTDEVIERFFAGNGDVIATTACMKGCIADILLSDYRINRKLEKERETCRKTEACVKRLEEIRKELKEKKEAVKETKKEIKRLEKAVSPETDEKINKLEKILEETDPKLKKYINAEERLKGLLEGVRESRKKLPGKKDMLKKLVQDVEEYEREIKDLKEPEAAYKKALRKINDTVLTGKDVLYKKAKEELMWYKDIFPCLYVELQYHGIPEEAYVMPLMADLAKELRIPVIAANDAHVSRKDENLFTARKILRYNYFEKAEKISDTDRELYIKSEDELREALCKILSGETVEEAVNNLSVLGTCRVEFPEEDHHPAVHGGESFDSLIEKERLRRINAGEWDDAHEERLMHEISVIKKMGYTDYHLIVRDFCIMGRKLGVIPKDRVAYAPYYDYGKMDEWIKRNGYRTGVGIGPGRGSAVGSLVCNMLGITKIDPLKYDLIFERFLNPERVSMPDIDTDVASAIRFLVIKYLKWEYGEDAVCSIGTETTYAAKNAIALAGRERAAELFGEDIKNKEERKLKQREYRNRYTLKISDLVPNEPGIKLSDCDEIFKTGLDISDPEIKLIISHAGLIEGKISGTGCHAGGVVISDNDNINDYLPLAWNTEKQVWYSQCDMIKVEEKGLLKMDILGVNTLDCISECIQMIERYENTAIDIDKIPFEREVFENIYAKGLTNAVFQFESDGMKSMLKEFKPDTFEDIILLVACYRPGPMQYLDNIIAVKNGKREISYKTPILENILKNTYGATVYQEQVMLIFQNLAGYSLGGADLVRRAMSKKKLDKLEVERKAFIYGDKERNIDGCVKRGVPEEAAEEIFNEMIEFAKYAFNKSHATAYAFVSYQTAWLKYHYPQYFFCAMFNNLKQEKYKALLSDCRKMGIRVLPPDINASYYDFVVEDGNVRYGLKGIKGLGEAYGSDIGQFCDERRNGLYADIKDFLKRNITATGTSDGIRYVTVRDKLMEMLIKTGCFDSMHEGRKDLIAGYDMKSDTLNGLRRMIDNKEIAYGKKDIKYNISQEIQYLDSVISVSLSDGYRSDAYYGLTPFSEIRDEGDYRIFGLVTGTEERKSKKGNDMLILTVQGMEGEITAIAMNRLYSMYKGDVLLGETVKMRVSYSGGSSVFIKDIRKMESRREEYFIDLDTEEKTLKFAEAVRMPGDGGETESVRVLCRYGGKTDLKKLKRPLVTERSLSENAVKYLKKQGIL